MRQAWDRLPLTLLPRNAVPATVHLFSTSSHLSSTNSNRAPTNKLSSNPSNLEKPVLTHLTQSGDAHMVSISSKEATRRHAVAKCNVQFSNHVAAELILENGLQKGDVLGVARIAGIMAAKRTADLIPLCHPIAIEHIDVKVILQHRVNLNAHLQTVQPDSTREAPVVGDEIQQVADEAELSWVQITATVSCTGKTGVEMEALTAASTAALTVYDMCKSVDKRMIIDNLRVVSKKGGASGTWLEGVSVP